MKNIIFIIFCFLAIVSCKAQIIAVEGFEDYPNELPDGAYIKDVNNVLNKFVGTWKGTYNNKNYEFEVTKYTRISEIRPLKFDKLLIRYKIIDTSGNIVVNTLNVSNDDKYIIRGSYLAKSGSYVLSYVGLNAKCGQNGSVFINAYNTDKMELFLQVNGEMYQECTTGAVEQVLPTDWIDLTKQ
jgi:hypothetical protein